MTGEFAIAVHSLVYMDHKACTLSSAELADNVCTNAARIRKVMATLTRSGLVTSSEGGHGGYALVRDAQDITLRQVAEALDISIVSAGWHSGDPDRDCMIASGMAGVLDGICSRLDATCMDELSRITIRGINDKIFSC